MKKKDVKKTMVLCGLACFCTATFAQEGYYRGDQDGMVPYEMENRKEFRAPLMTFEDCTQWRLETNNAVATLEPAPEKPMFDRASTGKLRYYKIGDNPSVIFRPVNKVTIDDDANTVAVWNWGSAGGFAVKEALSILVEDANGVEHEIDNFPQSVAYMYWHYQRKRIPEDIARPLTFTGIKLTNFAQTEEGVAYIDSVYFYSASQEKLTFEPFPETLPFPTRKETILPDQFLPCVVTSQAESETLYTFKAEEPGFTLSVAADVAKPFLDGIQVNGLFPFSGAKIILDDGTEVRPVASSSELKDGSLALQFPIPEAEDLLTCTLQLKNKSLIFDFAATADPGRIAKLELGEAVGQEITNSFVVPYLTFSGISVYVDNSSVDPRVIATKDFYLFSQFDWYNSDGSVLFGGTYDKAHPGRFNGGVEYLPKTDGKRNVLREKLFLNISPNLWEVFPTIANPPTPWKAVQGERLWITSGERFEPKDLLPKNIRYRKLGLDKITIRYHECAWRDDGDSFTFKLNAAPRFKGNNNVVSDFVSDIQELGWKIGLYTNYTDLAPVNSNWHDDHASQRPNGDFHWSWFRCYAPKPMWAWEMERKLAPQIAKRYGSDHSYCDVHSCVTPFERVDYDYRVPGAGMFRQTIACYGMIFLNEKAVYKGPVYSEGISHWFYAGLVDGNYGQYYLPADAPWFPDFNLRKIHMLEIDAGAESIGGMNEPGPRSVAGALIYGNIGIIGVQSTDAEYMERYYLMQPVQKHYIMEAVKSVEYADENGKLYPSSDAWRTPEIPRVGRIKVVYENGYTVSTNQGATPWNDLPQWGWDASTADGKTFSVRKLADGKVFEAASGPFSHYINGENANYRGMKVVNGAAALKLEATGWELIPARSYESFAFHKDLIQAGDKIVAVAVNESLEEVNRFELAVDGDGYFTAPACLDGVFKFLFVK